MKLAVFISALLLVSSCNWNADEGSAETDSTEVGEQTDSADPWHFGKYLNSANTSPLAKKIFNGTATLSDGDPTVFMDSLMANDREARPFYFRVITNSYSLADGAFAEALGAGGYNYVSKNFDEFSSYFTGPNAFADSAMRTWANIVLIEFSLRKSNLEQEPDIGKFIAEIKERCNTCSPEQLVVLDRLHKHMKNEWLRFLGEDPENAS